MTSSFWKKATNVDPILLLAVAALLSLGTIMIYSSSSMMATEKFGDDMYFLKRHISFLLLGVAATCVLFFLQLRWVKLLALPILGLSILALVVTLFSSAGVEANHATRWLKLGYFKFQPSEFVKPALLLYVASYISRKGKKIQDFQQGLLPMLLVIGLVFMLILKQPDFGTLVVLAVTILMMLFVGGARISHLSLLCAFFGMLSYFAVFGVGYRKKRLLSFLDPWGDPSGSGFQIIQSFMAFQRGGAVGRGLGDGTQKLLYLPEAHTDFILFSNSRRARTVWKLAYYFSICFIYNSRLPAGFPIE